MANDGIIKLDYPVTVDGKEVKELKMRRAKVRDTLAAEKASGGNAEKEVLLFANLTEQVPATIEDLDMADYVKLQGTYTDFLSSPPPTSGKVA